MANEIEILRPYENSIQEFPSIHNDFHNILMTMPMFANAYYYVPDSASTNWHYQSYSPVYGWRSLPGGSNFPFFLWFTAPYFNYYEYRQIFNYNQTSRTVDMAIQSSYQAFWTNNSNQALHGTSNLVIDNMRNIRMYKFKSQNVNGYWLDYTKSIDVNKIFIVKCINEITGDIEETPVIATNYGRNSGSNYCRLHPYASTFVDVASWKLTGTDSGFSNAYVMRQIRYENYLFPNVYIVSGGLFTSDKHIVTIDNNTYVHMCNDIYIRL